MNMSLARVRPIVPLAIPVDGWAVGGALGIAVLVAVTDALNPQIPLSEGWTFTVANPFGGTALPIVDRLTPGLIALLMTIIVWTVVSIGLRFWTAGRVERQQIKWVLAAGVVMGFGMLVGMVLPPSPFRRLLIDLGVLIVPLAIGVSILHYHLWDIGVIIRRTLVYAALTALLAGIFYGSVVLLQALLTRITGEQSPIVIVASTLIIAALFSPLRRRLQDFVDRRFYRRKYDAQHVLARFATVARDETELSRLAEGLTAVVEETLQPVRLEVWLAPGKRKGINDEGTRL